MKVGEKNAICLVRSACSFKDNERHETKKSGDAVIACKYANERKGAPFDWCARKKSQVKEDRQQIDFTLITVVEADAYFLAKKRNTFGSFYPKLTLKFWGHFCVLPPGFDTISLVLSYAKLVLQQRQRPCLAGT